MFRVQRFANNPIIRPAYDQSIGSNINGPSLVRVPAWLERPLGRYYLYFAHHEGLFIRLAYADQLEGPWKIYRPGTLRLDETYCHHHIASPDVHVDDDQQRFIMYFHGPILDHEAAATTALTQQFPVVGGQRGLAATSVDGLNFTAQAEILGSSYFRAFRWGEYVYAIGMPGIFYRSTSGLTGFAQGPILFDEKMRHAAVRRRGDTLQVFYTIVGDCPEHVVVSEIDLRPDWLEWQATPPVSVLQPELDYEGSHLPLEPSVRGVIHGPARQLRDPAIFEEDGRLYLLYAVAGESGLAIAELTEIDAG
jgi:hypothetical protein